MSIGRHGDIKIGYLGITKIKEKIHNEKYIENIKTFFAKLG